MNLHHDKEAFEELVVGASNELHIPANVIEKDYFVTLILKELSVRLEDMVFKGGTSLTKCYQLLGRFSEDIDISYNAEATTQTVERTLIDKIYAICDYYLEGKADRNSRHLYDIHKIYSQIKISEIFNELVSDVRVARAELSICPSAREGISINKLLIEIINKDIYKKDYKNITEGLLFEPLSYDNALTSLKAIVDANIFY